MQALKDQNTAYLIKPVKFDRFNMVSQQIPY